MTTTTTTTTSRDGSRGVRSAVELVTQLQEGESLREACCRVLGRRLSSTGEAISALYRLEEIAAGQAYEVFFRSGSAVCSESLQLTPVTEVTVTVRRDGRGKRVTWAVNGRRASRADAMAAGRMAWEGTYGFEADSRYGWAASGTHPAAEGYRGLAGAMTAADWVNVARCANRRKDLRFSPSAALGLSAAAEGWQAEHGSERMAIKQATRASRIGAGLMPVYS